MPLSWPHGVTRPGWRSHVSRETLAVARPVFRVPRGSGRGRGWSGHWCWSRGYDWVSARGVARGECKGGTSAKVGTYEVDGVKVEQGRLPTWGIAWLRTRTFTRRCVRTRRCGRPSRAGASRCIPTSRLPGGNAGIIDFKTSPIELDPAHIARIDQAIKSY